MIFPLLEWEQKVGYVLYVTIFFNLEGRCDTVKLKRKVIDTTEECVF